MVSRGFKGRVKGLFKGFKGGKGVERVYEGFLGVYEGF